MKKILLLFFFTCSIVKMNGQPTPKVQPTLSPEDSIAMSGSIRVGPAILNYNLDRGQSGVQTLHIINTKNTPYQFTFKPVDFMRDSTGEIVFFDSGSKSYSASGLITISQNIVELQPRERAEVPIRMTLPDTEDAGKTMKWTMLFVETKGEKLAPGKPSPTGISTTFNKSYSIGVQIYQTPPSTIKDVQMLAFDKVNDSTYSIIGENTGGAELKCKFAMELLSMETGEKKTISKKEVPMLPGQKRRVDLSIPGDVPKGKYQVVAMVDAGDDDIPLAAAQKEIEIN